MTYKIIHKPAFDDDFVDLPKNLQQAVVKAIRDLEDYAEDLRGNTIKPLKGFKNIWRYRQGDLRIIYAVGGNFVQLLAVGNRRDIYDRFLVPPDLPDDEGYTRAIEELLSFEHTGLHKSVERMLENLVESRRSQHRREEPLPSSITREKLKRWHIPIEHYEALLSCETKADLLRCKTSQESVERVLEYLYPRTVDQIAQQPDLQLGEPEDLIRYAEGDLLGFLLRLDSDQERYSDWALDGPTLIKGGPGSGKSTVALYRTRALVENGAGMVLFTTYTNALIKFSKQLLEQLMGDQSAQVQVSTLDSMAVQIVQNYDNTHQNIGGANEISAALSDAEIYFSQKPGARLEKDLLGSGTKSIRKGYLIEEIEWIIEGRKLSNVEEYLHTDRTGRGYAFNEYIRQAMWRIYEYVKNFLTERRIVTWGYIRSRALDLVKSGEWSKRWDAIIVDEAQDLTPAALALCVELCRDPQGVFLTADASQSLYNRGFRWKDVHKELKIVGRTRILKKNYRSSRQIAEAATEILRDTEAGDEEALDQIYVHSGPRPTIHICEDEEQVMLCLTVEIEEAAKDLRLPISAAAILTRTHELAKRVANILNDVWNLPARYMTSKELDLKCPQVKVLTLHSAKGLEFPIVALPFVEKDVLPQDLDSTQAEDWEQHLAAERRLFFVGCTRAMRRLIVTSREGYESPFLNDLNDNTWRWV